MRASLFYRQFFAVIFPVTTHSFIRIIQIQMCFIFTIVLLTVSEFSYRTERTETQTPTQRHTRTHIYKTHIETP